MSLKSLAKKKLEKVFAKQTKKIVQKHQPIIVAVAGSVGKTSTKLVIATLLSQKYKVKFQAGNYNTDISVPFIFLGRTLPGLYNPLGWFAAWVHGQKIVKKGLDCDVVIVELSTDKPGDIIKFKEFLRPNISVITAISQEHMEFFASLDAVAKEELTIAKYSDMLLVNSDDVNQKFINKYIPKTTNLHTYGLNSKDYSATIIKQHNNGIEFSVMLSSGVTILLNAPVIAKQSLKAIIGAVSVADLLGLTQEQITKGLSLVEPVAGRMQLLQGINQSIIIDDTYNSSPLACIAALDTLYSLDAPQKIAILGSMNELGNFSKAAHREIGEYCDSKKLDLVVTIGSAANSETASAAELNGCKVERCDSPYQAGDIVAKQVKDKAVILAKGSQNGVFAEESLKVLLANKSDESKLVRQSNFWLAKKRNQF